MFTTTSALPCTSLMCVNVVAILPPVYQSYVRSAGSVGTATYEEVIAQGRGLVWIETPVHYGVDNEARRVDRSVPCNIKTPPTTGAIGGGAKLIVHSQYIMYEDSFNDATATRRLKCKGLGVALRGFEGVEALPDDFLAECTLTSVDLSPGHKVRSVGVSFMLGCSEIDWIDLGGLKNVKTIDMSFMKECTSLTTISNFLCPETTNLERVGPGFLTSCSALSTVDLRPFRNITLIEGMFMAQCLALQSIDLTPLSNVTHIESFFMYKCGLLKKIEFEPLRKVTNIGSFFMAMCMSLEGVDVTPLSNVTSVGDAFMHGAGLKEVKDFGIFSPPMAAILRTIMKEQHHNESTCICV